MSNKIKFSHEYYKLNNIADKSNGGKHPVTLLEVFIKKSEELGPAFMEYDTTYFDGKAIARYPLKKGEHLILLFRDFKGNLFTTVRSRWGKGGDKLEYYLSKRGESFEIEIMEANNA